MFEVWAKVISIKRSSAWLFTTFIWPVTTEKLMKYCRFLHLAHICAKTTHLVRVIRRERLRVGVLQGRRNLGARAPPKY